MGALGSDLVSFGVDAINVAICNSFGTKSVSHLHTARVHKSQGMVVKISLEKEANRML